MDDRTPEGLDLLLRRARFEVLPVGNVQQEVRAFLPRGTTVHVVCPWSAGPDVSVQTAVSLAASGYDVVPHIAARTVRDTDHLRALLETLGEAGVRTAFLPGGDGKECGAFRSAVELIEELEQLDHGLTGIGVTAYPQGHPRIPRDVLMEVLLEKQRVATFMVSESCLDPAQTLAWLREARAAGVTLPLMIGLPGLVPVRRLYNAFREFGLAEAFGYLRKQHGMVSALLRRRFSPVEVVFGLAPHASDEPLGIDRIHFFTFNEVAATEEWRSRTLADARSAR